jgi:hypothetical protein
LPLGFGIGHIAIGVLVARDRREHP